MIADRNSAPTDATPPRTGISPFRAAGLWLLVIGLLLGYNFAYKRGYNSRPYYHNADPDTYFAGQGLVIANGGYLFTTLYPASHAVFGGVYRAAAALSPGQRALTRVDQVRTPDETNRLLTLAVSDGRITSLWAVVLLIVVLTLGFYCATGCNVPFATALALCAATMPPVVHYSSIMRPDHVAVLMALLGLLVLINFHRTCARTPFLRGAIELIGAGVLFGLAVLVKIQVIPLVLASVGIVLAVALVRHTEPGGIAAQRFVPVNLLVLLLSAAAFPWWALTKPQFLTPQFYGHLGADWHRLYGAMPMSVEAPVTALYAGLAVLSAALFAFRAIRESPLSRQLAAFSVIANLLFLGVVLATYLALLPVSSTVGMYVENTRHMMYATVVQVANTVTGGGFLEYNDGSRAPIGLLQKLAAIAAAHGSCSPLAGISIMYFVAICSAAAVYRLATLRTATRPSYLVPLYLFAIAFGIDYLSAMRLNTFVLYPHYIIHSILLYVAGIFYTAYLECYGLYAAAPDREDSRSAATKRVKRGAVYAAVIVHIGMFFTTATSACYPDIAQSVDKGSGILTGYSPQLLDWLHLNEQFTFSKTAHDEGFRQYVLETSAPVGSWDLGIASTASAGSRPARGFYPSIGGDSRGVYLGRLGARDGGLAGDMTLAVWFQVGRFPLGEQQICGSAAPPELNFGLTLLNAGVDTRKVNGYYGRGNADGGVSVTSSTNVVPGVWYSAVLTRNAAGLHLYLDGKRVASDPRPVAAASLSEVGCSHGVAGMPGRFRVASVAVWDRALTDRDVERLYALQHGPDHFSKGDIVRLSNAVFFQ